MSSTAELHHKRTTEDELIRIQSEMPHLYLSSDPGDLKQLRSATAKLAHASERMPSYKLFQDST